MCWEKYHAEKGFQQQFSAKRLGKLESVDVSSPNKIVCFYREVGAIVILDNQLSEIRRIDLFQLGFFNVDAVCRARDNAIWLFDRSDARLRKISFAGKVLLEGAQLNLGDQLYNITRLTETATHLVLVDTQEVHLLSVQLVYQNNLKDITTSTVSFVGDKLVYKDIDRWVTLDLNTLQKKPLLLPADLEMSRVNRVLINNQYLMVHVGQVIKTYRRT